MAKRSSPQPKTPRGVFLFRGAHPQRAKPAAYARRLVLMVKAPVLGRTKTRLAKEIGAAGAMRFYRHTTAAVLGRVGASTAWQTILCVSPDRERASRVWPGRHPRLAQGGGDLGARMQRAIERVWAGPLIIIGSDVPGIEARHIRQAFRLLGGHDVVVGPSPDGGYWLFGLKRTPKVVRAFEGVRWSSGHALADTLKNVEGLRVAHAATLADVDDAGDLAREAQPVGRRILPVSARRGVA